nr:MAG TPA: hypothetical protein [Caudoviricetes sp.]
MRYSLGQSSILFSWNGANCFSGLSQITKTVKCDIL